MLSSEGAIERREPFCSTPIVNLLCCLVKRTTPQRAQVSPDASISYLEETRVHSKAFPLLRRHVVPARSNRSSV
jgi:hypothetical protein